MRRITEIEKAGLIVPANVAFSKKRDGSVFDFVLVAGGGAEVFEQIAGLRAEAGAVVLVVAAGIGEVAKLFCGDGGRTGLHAELRGIKSVKALNRIGGELAVVGFC